MKREELCGFKSYKVLTSADVNNDHHLREVAPYVSSMEEKQLYLSHDNGTESLRLTFF